MIFFVSGAAGYIGGAISRALAGAGDTVFGGLRGPALLAPGITPFITGDLSDSVPKLPELDAVVHAAGLGHRRGLSEAGWRRANVDAAVNLAYAARAAGAKKFILISTAYIHGRVHDRLITDTTPPNPMDLYAESKLQAEHDAAGAFGAGFGIIRPAAVIGPGCPGNIPLLLNILRRGIPLPFAGIKNRRSFIDRDDLARLVLAVLRAPVPPEAVLAAHPEVISTPGVVLALAEGLNVHPRLFACPPRLLRAGAGLLGRGAMWQSLAGDFRAAPQAALALGWRPAASLSAGFANAARG